MQQDPSQDSSVVRISALMTVLPYLASLVLASSHFVQTGKKRERVGKREPQCATKKYSPPKSPRSGLTFHYDVAT